MSMPGPMWLCMSIQVGTMPLVLTFAENMVKAENGLKGEGILLVHCMYIATVNKPYLVASFLCLLIQLQRDIYVC